MSGGGDCALVTDDYGGGGGEIPKIDYIVCERPLTMKKHVEAKFHRAPNPIANHR